MEHKFRSAPRDPAGYAPPRRRGSIRRTSTIDVVWPGGYGQPMLMSGRARDLITRADGETILAAQARSDMAVSYKREILEISVAPERPEAQQLIGMRAGRQSRKMLAELMPDELQRGTALYLLLDDFAGASLVAGWAWSKWVDDWGTFMRESGIGDNVGREGVATGVCIGFRPGSAALTEDGRPRTELQKDCPVGSLINPDDPDGWHVLAAQEGVAMRRARRIDVWVDADLIGIDVGFQDSATTPAGPRVAVHEYSLAATADRETGSLVSLAPRAHILPFPECPEAIAKAMRIAGQPLKDLRSTVLDMLPGALGCTHLNDVLRSIADAPQLAKRLEMPG